jgi:hypothetical protein
LDGWHDIRAHYITNRARSSPINILDTGEGDQQEEMALWLIDGLQPTGAFKNPLVHEGPKSRELSDLLMSYSFGTTLVESKSLAILGRKDLPDRSKLSGTLIKHVHKAARQLSGGVRSIQRNARIADGAGEDVWVERTQPIHSIILVPDLSLLGGATELGVAFMLNFFETTKGFLHILDPAELLRIVQAAEIIAEESDDLTVMMAFDYYLMQRSHRAVQQPTPYFQVLFRRGRSPA